MAQNGIPSGIERIDRLLGIKIRERELPVSYQSVHGGLFSQDYTTVYIRSPRLITCLDRRTVARRGPSNRDDVGEIKYRDINIGRRDLSNEEPINLRTFRIFSTTYRLR